MVCSVREDRLGVTALSYQVTPQVVQQEPSMASGTRISDQTVTAKILRLKLSTHPENSFVSQRSQAALPLCSRVGRAQSSQGCTTSQFVRVGIPHVACREHKAKLQSLACVGKLLQGWGSKGSWAGLAAAYKWVTGVGEIFPLI